VVLKGYDQLPGFEHLYLEDSWVLGVHESDDELRFDVEAVLTESHPDWHPPKDREVYAYKRLALVFARPRQVTWLRRMSGPPAVDASGEVDYGNIDLFEWENDTYELEGEWGRVRVRCCAGHRRHCVAAGIAPGRATAR
jgi:hypothetical protein